jgi:hypothetical protein
MFIILPRTEKLYNGNIIHREKISRLERLGGLFIFLKESFGVLISAFAGGPRSQLALEKSNQ